VNISRSYFNYFRLICAGSTARAGIATAAGRVLAFPLARAPVSAYILA